MDNAGRNQTIDAFRAIAILSVMAYHYTVRWAPPHSATDLYCYPVAFSQVLTAGRYGVQLFFVISGLVITMTVRRVPNALSFAGRRFARLFPALFVAASATALACLTAPPDLRATLGDWLASLTFFPERFGHRPVDGVYWSLAVEVTFYAWVALLVGTLRDRFWIGLVLLGVIGAAFHANATVAALLIPAYWPYFLIGLGGWYAVFERRARPAAIAITTALACLAFYNASKGASVVVLPMSGVLFLLLWRNAQIPILPWFGRISYSLYLIHQNIGVMLIGRMQHAGTPVFVTLPAVGLGAVVLAWAMYRFVELPGQQFLTQALRRKSRPFRQEANQVEDPPEIRVA